MLQRVLSHSLVVGLVPAVLACTSSWVLAQGNPGQVTLPPRTASTVPAPAGSSVPQARPVQSQAQPPATERKPADPQLVRILQIWEQHTGKIKRMQGEFLRYEYDKVFRVERRHNGKYYYEAPDQGRMDFLPDKELPEPPTHVVDGVEFQVASGTAEAWICNGEDLFSIQIDQKTYHQIAIPAQYRGEAIKDGPLPFLFGMKAEDALKKYDMELGPMHMKEPNPMIHLVAYPLMELQRREFQKAELLINPKTFEPIAVKLFDPSGNKETVYRFTKHDQVTLPWIPSKFKVNLAAYKCLNEQKAPPRQETYRVDPDAPVIR